MHPGLKNERKIFLESFSEYHPAPWFYAKGAILVNETRASGNKLVRRFIKKL
jgi:hypothetical protein